MTTKAKSTAPRSNGASRTSGVKSKRSAKDDPRTCPGCVAARLACKRHDTKTLREKRCDARCPKHSPRMGFARLPPAEVSAIAAKGGKASQESGKAYRFTSKEAEIAGRKGGLATREAWRKIRQGKTNEKPREEAES